MKKAVFLSLFLLAPAVAAMAQQLSFGYDASGNQTDREWICVSCGTYPPAFSTPPGLSKSPELTAMLDTAYRLKPQQSRLIAYPNPVMETLFLRQEGGNGVYIKTAEVYSMNGTRVLNAAFKPEGPEPSVAFGSLSAGFYLVRISYSDGRQDVVKVVKL